MGMGIWMVVVVVEYGLLLTGCLMATSGDELIGLTHPRPGPDRTVVIVVCVGVRNNLRISTLQKLQRIPGRKAKGDHVL